MRLSPGVAALLGMLVALAGCVSRPPETRDPQGDYIRFVAQNGIATANGIFHDWRVVDSHVDRADVGASWVEIEIDVASIDTGIERRDDHLRDPDFFEVERWPVAKVRVSDVRPRAGSAAGPFDARFDVAIRDRRQSLPGTFSITGESPLVVEGAIEIDRTAFGVGASDRWWNPVTPRDRVPVRFRVTLE